MERFNSGITDLFKMEVDDQAKGTFIEMARWTKFIATVFFVMFGLAIAGGLAFAFMLPGLVSSSPQLGAFSAMGPAIIIFYLVFLIGIYFYPTYALLRSSKDIKEGLNTGNKELFNEGVRYLKNMFKYMGILMIVMLSLYGIIIIFALFGAMMANR